jgi:SAM-dependent methyltransferase
MTPTRRYFDKHARAFDRLYARRSIGAYLRRAPQRGRELAVSVVARHRAPDVLDLGCGPGRVAEAVIEAGAASYVGVDFSPEMLALARRRLDGQETVELLEGDFLDIDVPRTFDVVLALGLFDYLAEPARAASWMRAHCGSTLVASFPRWDWVKAPLRHLHYAIHRCSIYEYTEAGASELLHGAGFSNVEFPSRGRRGFFVSATVE